MSAGCGWAQVIVAPGRAVGRGPVVGLPLPARRPSGCVRKVTITRAPVCTRLYAAAPHHRHAQHAGTLALTK